MTSKQKARSVWRSILYRCRTHKNYVGRIKVCERWQDFENFYADMGDPPEGLSLDRYPNNHGDYEKSNCRWATQKQQIENSDQIRGLTHLNRAEAEQIRTRFAAGEPYQDLAAEFERSQAQIHKIARGSSFRDADEWTPAEIAEAQTAINNMRRRALRS